MSTFLRLKTRTVLEIGGYNVTDDATFLGEIANEAVRDFLLQSGVQVVTATLTLTANTNDYTLDAAVLRIKHAYLDGATDHMLEQISGADLIERRTRGSNASGSDAPWVYALEGTDLFRVYPTPTATGTIQLTCIQKPTEMSADAHDPSIATYGGIPTEHHPALLAYMYWQAASADDDSSSAQGERYERRYEAEIRKARKALNMKGGRLPRARIGGRRNIPPSDPSIVVR